MGLFSKSGNKTAPEVVAIFDVGSGSIGAALVTISRQELPNILWSTRIPITLQGDINFDQLTKTMLSTLLDVALELQSKGLPLLSRGSGPKHLSDVMFSFASPWYSMQAKAFKIDKEESFALTPQFIKNLIKREEREFYNLTQKNEEKKAEGEGKTAMTPVLIERSVIQTTLNGYIVSNPYDKNVKQAQVDLVLSAIPSYLYDKANEIRKQLISRHSDGVFHSFILPAFSVTRDIFHGNKSFLFIDVSAEVTDIATVHKGTIIDATSFPYGKHFIIREVAGRFNTTSEEAVSMLSTYLVGDSSPEQAERLRNILRDAQDKWLSNFMNTMANIAVEAPLPKNIYLTADDEYGHWFKEAITSGDYSDYALSKMPFRVTILGSETLKNYITYNRLTAQLDPFLALEAIFLQKALYEEE